MDFSVDWFRGKKVTVMGLGVHGGGLGVAKWLLRRGARLTVTDLASPADLARSRKALEAECARCLKRPPFGVRIFRPRYVLGRHDEADFSASAMVIRNPAVPREHPLLALAKRHGVPVESDISLFFRLCPYPIAAVTGTKGKTTTAVLLAEICRRHDPRTVVGGNMRISPMDGLDRLLSRADRGESAPPIVLELSSWQVETLEGPGLSPQVAVITNILRDHLNRYHGKMSEYAAAKEILVRFQGPDGVAVLNSDNRWTVAMARRLRRRSGGPLAWGFSAAETLSGDGCRLAGGQIIFRAGGEERAVVPLKSIRIPGEHNVMNVMAAASAALAIGMPLKTVAAGIRAFRGVPDRLEKVAVRGGIAYINDTTATMPEASAAAISALSARSNGKGGGVVLIAGGADKDLNFREWAKAVAGKAKALVLFSGKNTTATDKMLKALKAAKSRVPWTLAGSMEEAVEAAGILAERGDTVLLSPGAASFGIFRNEFDRGERFVAAVHGKKRRK